ncbi:17555_t:CDS:2, partial [Racocetra fulgida]
ICNLTIIITPLAPILGSFGSAMRAVQCIRPERAINELKLPTIFDSTTTEKIQIQKSPISPKLNRLNSWRDFEPKLDKNED